MSALGNPASNPARGEAALVVAGKPHVLRPSFTALVAAEGELGPLYGLVERAAASGLTLAETTALFWHCVEGGLEGEKPPREAVGEAVAALGLAGTTPSLAVLLRRIVGQP